MRGVGRRSIDGIVIVGEPKISIFHFKIDLWSFWSDDWVVLTKPKGDVEGQLD